MLKKVLAVIDSVSSKALALIGAAGTTAAAAAVSVSANSGIETALSGLDTAVLLSGFYAVLPTILTVALPILGAKIGINFLFSAVKGA